MCQYVYKHLPSENSGDVFLLKNGDTTNVMNHIVIPAALLNTNHNLVLQCVYEHLKYLMSQVCMFETQHVDFQYCSKHRTSGDTPAKAKLLMWCCHCCGHVIAFILTSKIYSSFVKRLKL